MVQRRLDPFRTKPAYAHDLHGRGIRPVQGWSVREPCWAYGVPLFDGAGVPVAVFNPSRVHVRGEAYRLLAGLLLLFPYEAQRRLFLQNKYRAPGDPAGGWQTEIVTASDGGGINASAAGRVGFEPEPAD